MSDLLKIKLKDIPPEGMEYQTCVPADVAAFREDGLTFVKPFTFAAQISKTAAVVIAAGNLKGEYSALCGRCLDDVRCNWEINFVMEVPFQRHDEFVDLTDNVRQEIILSLPSKILCKESCRGLCIYCGTNLNLGTCQCSKQIKTIDIQENKKNDQQPFKDLKWEE